MDAILPLAECELNQYKPLGSSYQDEYSIRSNVKLLKISVIYQSYSESGLGLLVINELTLFIRRSYPERLTVVSAYVFVLVPSEIPTPNPGVASTMFYQLSHTGPCHVHLEGMQCFHLCLSHVIYLLKYLSRNITVPFHNTVLSVQCVHLYIRPSIYQTLIPDHSLDKAFLVLHVWYTTCVISRGYIPSWKCSK